MGNSDSSFLIIAVLAVALIWVSSKLRSEKDKNRSLIKRNSELSSANAELHAELTGLRKDVVLLKNNNLKFQLQPHTLANVVDTINSIAQNLQRGTNSLVDSLNYILYKGDDYLVSVEDEIGFIRKYIELNELLYSNILDINFDLGRVSQESIMYRVKNVPHLISAYFIENAFKHGDVSQPEFLTISVTLSDEQFELKVVNRINKGSRPKDYGGVGLQNMKNRLELLAENRYVIETNEIDERYHANLKIIFNYD